MSTKVEELTNVCDLVDFEKMEWKEEVINSVFNERDRKCILSIPLNDHVPKDVITWAFSKDGMYSTKTAYMLGKGCNFDLFHKAWVELWGLDVSPKVKHFVWRCCTKTLPVRDLLKSRHLIEDASCPWCGVEDETAAHALFECTRVHDLWLESECAAARPLENEEICDLLVRWGTLGKKIQQRASILAWVIWVERNDKVFSNKITPNEILLARVYKAVEEFELYNKKVYAVSASKPKPCSKTWVAPLVGVIKINSDASLSDEGWVGLGVVARNHEGKVLFAATRRVRAWWCPEIAEGKALLLVVKLAHKYGLENVILESDSQVLINRLEKHVVFLSDLDVVLDNILTMYSSFMSCSWSHVKRDGNFVAHHLAKIMPFGVGQVWVNHCPAMVSPYVLSDALSIN